MLRARQAAVEETICGLAREFRSPGRNQRPRASSTLRDGID